MSRRGRFIPSTDDELRRLEEAHIAKQRLVESRKGLSAKSLRTQRKDWLLQRVYFRFNVTRPKGEDCPDLSKLSIFHDHVSLELSYAKVL